MNAADSSAWLSYFASDGNSAVFAEPIEEAHDREQALGTPDYGKGSKRGYVLLGCSGELVLKFTDNRLIDIPGPDLYVFEVGPAVVAGYTDTVGSAESNQVLSENRARSVADDAAQRRWRYQRRLHQEGRWAYSG